MFALWYIYLGWEEYRRVQGLQWSLPNSQRWTPEQKQLSPQPTNQTNGKQTTPKASPPSSPISKGTKPPPQSPVIDKNTAAKVAPPPPPPPPSPIVPPKTPTTTPQNVQPSLTRDQPIPKPPPPPVQQPKPSPQQPIPQSRSKFHPDPQLSPESRIFQSTKINDDPPSKISPIMLDSPQAPKPPTNIFSDPSKFPAATDFQSLTQSTPKQNEKYHNFGRQPSKLKPNENLTEKNDDRVVGQTTEQTIKSVNTSVDNEEKSTENTTMTQENLDLIANIDAQTGNVDLGIDNQSEQLGENVNPSPANETVLQEKSDMVNNIDGQVANFNGSIGSITEQPTLNSEVKLTDKMATENSDLVANIEEHAENVGLRIDSQSEQLGDFVNLPVENNGLNLKSVHLQDLGMVVEEEGQVDGVDDQNETSPIDASSEKLTKPAAMEVSFGNSEELERGSEDAQAAGRATVTYLESNPSNDGGAFLWNQELEDNARFIDSASETFSRMSIKSMLSADSILRGSDEVMSGGKQRVCKKPSWPRRVSISDDPPETMIYLTETTTSRTTDDQLPSEEQIPFDVKMRRELELTAAVLREDWLRKMKMSTAERQSQSDEEMVVPSENDEENLENADKVTDNEQSDTCQAKQIETP